MAGKRVGGALSGSAGRAALGLAAAAATAYGAYMLRAPGGRRRPVTELRSALDLPLRYVKWRGLHYACYVRPGRGRPIVVLHSINAVASAHEMRPLVQRLVRETDRPIHVLEWLGFGHSDRPDTRYTPALLEDQLEHLLLHLPREGGYADLIGLSLGATFAAALARRRTDLIGRLVAIEPAGLGDDPQAIGRAWSRLLFTLPGVQQAFYDRLTTPDALYRFAAENLFTPEFGVPDEFVEFGAETARVEGAARPLDDFLEGRLFPDDAAELFLRLRQPVLVLHGTVASRRMESDDHLPELAARPNVEVHALPTGSLPHWERPGEVHEHVSRFLELGSETSAPRPDVVDQGAR